MPPSTAGSAKGAAIGYAARSGNGIDNMSGAAIPDDLRRFIVVNALTVPDIEALLIFRAVRDTTWTAATLAARLYVPVPRAAQVIVKLDTVGAIAPQGDAWTYHPRASDLDLLFGSLEDYYSRHLIEITRLIHASEDQAARDFADAFRIRREKP